MQTEKDSLAKRFCDFVIVFTFSFAVGLILFCLSLSAIDMEILASNGRLCELYGLFC